MIADGRRRAFLSVLLLRERPRASHYLLGAACFVGALLIVILLVSFP